MNLCILLTNHCIKSCAESPGRLGTAVTTAFHVHCAASQAAMMIMMIMIMVMIKIVDMVMAMMMVMIMIMMMVMKHLWAVRLVLAGTVALSFSFIGYETVHPNCTEQGLQALRRKFAYSRLFGAAIYKIKRCFGLSQYVVGA